jgi:hypothetical protein
MGWTPPSHCLSYGRIRDRKRCCRSAVLNGRRGCGDGPRGFSMHAHSFPAIVARATWSNKALKARAPKAHLARRISLTMGGTPISTAPQSPGSARIQGSAAPASTTITGLFVHTPTAAHLDSARSQSSSSAIAPSRARRGTYFTCGKRSGSAIMTLW